MSKKAALAFFLSLLVIISYNYYTSKKYPPLPQEVLPQQQQERVSFPVASQEPLFEETSSLSSFPLAKGAKDIVVETDLLRLVITTSGARIKSCQLKGYPEERITPKAVQAQMRQIQQGLFQATGKRAESLGHEQKKLELLLQKIEQRPEMAELVSLAASAGTDFAPTIVFGGDKNVHPDLNTALYQCNQYGLKLSAGQPQGQVTFLYTDDQGRKLKKVFSFSNYNYAIGLNIDFQGWSEVDTSLTEHFLLYYGPDVGLPQAERGRRTFGYQGPVTYFLNAQKGWVKREKYTREESDIFVHRQHPGKIGWVGLENKYFLAALIPYEPAEAVVVEKNRYGEHKIALKVPWKGSRSYDFRLYLGPKKVERLKEIGVTLDKAIDYGFFGAIARLIYKILLFFSRWTNNFGWAIVLLCLVVKIVFYPLTHRSFESMQKMQQDMKTIQPEMNAVREKFKDNPQKLNKEIMALYRRRGVNPMASCQSGCLPLLLQMPVFFALYAVLYNSIELRATPFLWLQDLSAKDPYYILPVLMGISMFVQQKLTGMGAAGGGAQQEQAKMMAIMMPLLLTWIFASLPSGVVLYWFVFNLATSLQQVLIRKKQLATGS
ncbi:MAG: membrane protein insertase YidC [Omnitrophica bacterium]|nr:membrane protein insertase YidC [Candidatus Omnitrophota bacterium]